MSSTNDRAAELDPHDEPNDIKGDSVDDPAHSTDEDEGWTSEGGATPSGPATDVDSDA